MAVHFIDTSVLCNLIPVPGRDQDRISVLQRLDLLLRDGVTMILPVTSVIETGNHIAQLNDGGQRRQTAQKFVEILTMVAHGKAPWVLHDFAWDRDFLENLVAGGGTGVDLLEHATQGVGAGDVCLLTERWVYQKRTRRQDVHLWTLDQGLAARA